MGSVRGDSHRSVEIFLMREKPNSPPTPAPSQVVDQMLVERDTVRGDNTDQVKPLNLRQQKFVENYLTSGNATRSAEAAGYKHPNVQAFRLLDNISVKAGIDTKRAKMSRDTEGRRERWIERLETLGEDAVRDADRLRAIEQLFKAEGWIAPERKEVVQFSGAFLADLDLDELEGGSFDDTILNENNTLQ